MRILESYVIFFISMKEVIFAITDEYYWPFYNEILNVHNEYRKNHNVAPLILDKELCEKAKNYLITKENEEDLKREYGTNIYFRAKGLTLDARKIVRCWYNKKYDTTYKEFPSTEFYKEPFTNIVWENTTKIGVAVYEDQNFCTILVIYSPRGDIIEEPTKNNKNVPLSRLQDVNQRIVRKLF